jgi:hypothetical protein
VDTARFIDKVTELRGKTKEQHVYSKLGIDGGRGSIKIELTLLYEGDKVLNQGEQPPRKRAKVNSRIRWMISVIVNALE